MIRMFDIIIEPSRDNLFSPSGLSRLREGYMKENETSPQERFAFISKQFSSNPEHAQRLYDYSSKMWLSYATPILSYGKTKRSLPISCYGSFLDDSIASILETSTETRMLAVTGGGVGLHVGIRPADTKSSGILPHLKTYDVDTLAYKQGTTRRGATAAYLDINHPEIIEFLEMRKPTGGDPNLRCLNLHHGINISDDFMNRIEQLSLHNTTLTDYQKQQLDQFPLISPWNKQLVRYISARELWERILTVRMETGEPYLWFSDTVNKNLPQYQKDLGLTNKGSNLCSEISLCSDIERTFVCCLSSVNLEYYDLWKDNPLFIADIVEMLDNVIDVFRFKGAQYPELKKAVYSAMRERAIGIGALGWHALLQKKMIPFESPMAVGLNRKIWQTIKQQAKQKTVDLAIERDPCPDSDPDMEITFEDNKTLKTKGSTFAYIVDPDKNNKGGVRKKRVWQLNKDDEFIKLDQYMNDHFFGKIIHITTSNKDIVRNSHLLSIAPNASTSYLMDTSPSIEPYRANVFLEKGVGGTNTHRNKYLEILLESKQTNTPAVWSSIIANDGSVANLDCLEQWEKDVFKTAMEIDQQWIIQHAADRQEYICQAQSVNLFFSPTTNVEVLHLMHLMAWKTHMKSLYYCRSDNMRKADSVGTKVLRQKIEDMKDTLTREEDTCIACS